MAQYIAWTALSIVLATTTATELVPERFLRPRDFNHHPFTDVGSNPGQRTGPSLPETHPYAILSSKKPREGRQFPEQDVVLYPNPPEQVLPRKLHPDAQQVHHQFQPELHQVHSAQHLSHQELQQVQPAQPHFHNYELQQVQPAQPHFHHNELQQVQLAQPHLHNHEQQQVPAQPHLHHHELQQVQPAQPHLHREQQQVYPEEAVPVPIQPAHPVHSDPYHIIPKNYAFSYSVKDQHSGDDFSHSQAHNGKATRGQYRVKLPDGRVQVVSYTADHKGYRADVQYEGAAGYPQATPIYENKNQAAAQPVQQQPRYAPTAAPYIHSPTPTPYIHQQSYSPTPTPLIHEQSYSPTPNPHIHGQSYSPTPTPHIHQQSYSPTPTPLIHEQSYSPTPTPHIHEQSYSPTPGTYNAQQYVHGYGRPTSTYDQAIYASPSRPPFQNNYAPATPTTFEQQYESPTPSYPEDTYHSPTPGSYQTPAYATGSPGLQAYASPSPTPYHQAPSAEGYEGSQSPFAVEPHLRSTPAPFAHQQYESSTVSPTGGQVLVTPRTLFNAALARRGFGSQNGIVYKFSSPA